MIHKINLISIKSNENNLENQFKSNSDHNINNLNKQINNITKFSNQFRETQPNESLMVFQDFIDLILNLIHLWK